jgi:predicted TIM-barrel enzyme
VAGTTKRTHPLYRYRRLLQRRISIFIDIDTHTLLSVYAKKHNYSLREAANRVIATGLAMELAREDARKERKEREELLK